jgi:plasmid stabilization system protein ParE
VRWSEHASADLIDILEFIDQEQPAAARKIGRAILSSASRLKRHPHREKPVPEMLEQGISDYRQILVTVYRIIYRVRTETVDILAVLDSRRDITAALLQRLVR